jgi:hypothetical protein
MTRAVASFRCARGDLTRSLETYFPSYCLGVVVDDPTGAGAIPNTSHQTTVLLGLTT